MIAVKFGGALYTDIVGVSVFRLAVKGGRVSNSTAGATYGALYLGKYCVATNGGTKGALTLLRAAAAGEGNVTEALFAIITPDADGIAHWESGMRIELLLGSVSQVPPYILLNTNEGLSNTTQLYDVP